LLHLLLLAHTYGADGHIAVIQSSYGCHYDSMALGVSQSAEGRGPGLLVGGRTGIDACGNSV